MTFPMNNFARFDPQQFSWKRVFLLVAAVQLVLISMITNMVALGMSLYMMQVFDRVLTSQSKDTLFFLALAISLAIGLGAILHLQRVDGRPVASVGGFAYSDGMVAHGGDWTPEALQEFLTAPKKVVKGTKMTFAGLGKVEDRANLIAYLETQK